MTEEKKVLYLGMIYEDAGDPMFEIIAPTAELAKAYLANYAVEVLENEEIVEDAREAGWDTMSADDKLQWMESNASYAEFEVRQVEVGIVDPGARLLPSDGQEAEATPEAPLTTTPGLSSEVVAAQLAFQTMAKLKGN